MPPTQGSGWSSRTRAGSPPEQPERDHRPGSTVVPVSFTPPCISLSGDLDSAPGCQTQEESRSAGGKAGESQTLDGPVHNLKLTTSPLCDLWGGCPSLGASTAPSVQWEGSRPTVQGCCRAPSDGAGSVWPSSWCSLST